MPALRRGHARTPLPQLLDTAKMTDQKVYLGDGAYASFDGFAITLTAENGIEATDSVVLEPAVFDALLRVASRWGFTKTNET